MFTKCILMCSLIHVISAAPTVELNVSALISEGFQSIKPEDFLKYHIFRGLTLTQLDKLESTMMSDDFSIELYKFLSKNGKKDKICFPNIGCIDMRDPGNFPPTSE